MSRTNLSCQSCMCCTEDDIDLETPCCDSRKCEVNQRRNNTACRETQTRICSSFEQKQYVEKCRQITVPIDPSCPICRGSMTNYVEAEPPCEECKIAKKEAEHGCPTCKTIQANSKESKAEHSCPACKSQQHPSKTNSKETKAEHSCPACKSQYPKIQEKEVRCPTCSQPIAMPCCDSHTVSIMIIPEKLLKDNSTATEDEDTDEEDKPCCKKAEEKKEKPYCAVEACKSKKPEPKIEEPISCCAQVPCCALESCKSNKKPTAVPNIAKPIAEEQKNGKNGKAKTEKKITCGEECKAMKEEPTCCCVFPPAYRQYSCIGKISGNCDCEKPPAVRDKKDE